jgi:hypothetical protein
VVFGIGWSFHKVSIDREVAFGAWCRTLMVVEDLAAGPGRWVEAATASPAHHHAAQARDVGAIALVKGCASGHPILQSQ